MVSVKAAATGSVSCGPMVRGLGPLEQTETNKARKLSSNNVDPDLTEYGFGVLEQGEH